MFLQSLVLLVIIFLKMLAVLVIKLDRKALSALFQTPVPALLIVPYCALAITIYVLWWLVKIPIFFVVRNLDGLLTNALCRLVPEISEVLSDPQDSDEQSS